MLPKPHAYATDMYMFREGRSRLLLPEGLVKVAQGIRKVHSCRLWYMVPLGYLCHVRASHHTLRILPNTADASLPLSAEDDESQASGSSWNFPSFP